MELLWIPVTASLLAVASSLLGSFLLLRRMALLGDAVSHAVLPGIVLAYLWSGVRELPVMLLGAGVSALVAVFLLQVLQHRFGWHADAALAAVLASFFAVGILLLSAFGGKVDLDVECVLYGELAYVPLDMVTVGPLMVPRAALWALLLVGIAAVVLLVAWKELVVSTFDPEFAEVSGMTPKLWQAVLLGMTAMAAVVGFVLVGAILVVALLTVPAATARLLTARLLRMVGIAVLVSISSTVAGYVAASNLGGAVAGWMVLAATLQFIAAVVWSWLRRCFRPGPSVGVGTTLQRESAGPVLRATGSARGQFRGG
ncbi:MAG: metal ABC transporter permease [Chlorobiota bacterium]